MICTSSPNPLTFLIIKQILKNVNHFLQKIILDIVTTIYYYITMVIEWNEEKNELLKATRNVSFEQVKAEIEAKRNTEPMINPTHPNQYITVVKINDYPCVVPFVEMENGGWFLKTIYQSRKLKGKV